MIQTFLHLLSLIQGKPVENVACQTSPTECGVHTYKHIENKLNKDLGPALKLCPSVFESYYSEELLL